MVKFLGKQAAKLFHPVVITMHSSSMNFVYHYALSPLEDSYNL